MRIAVSPVDEVHSRAAATLVGSHRVSMVGLIGKNPPRSWGDAAMKVPDGAGFDRVIGPSADVTPGGEGAVRFAGLTGLARSLASRLDGLIVEMDRTFTSTTPGQGEFAVFPSPLGAIRRAGSVEGVFLCPTGASLAGVSVKDANRQIAIIDDVLFASGVCLAAGALLPAGHRGPVWAEAEAYLELVEELGLVSAEAVTDAT